MSVITILRQLLRKPDARDALYLALCVEGDCETVTHRSQIGQRHAPRLAGHLPVDGLGYFIQGCEALALVAPREMSRRPKGSWTGGSGAGRSEYAKQPQVQSPETWRAWFTLMPRRMRRLAHLVEHSEWHISSSYAIIYIDRRRRERVSDRVTPSTALDLFKFFT